MSKKILTLTNLRNSSYFLIRRILVSTSLILAATPKEEVLNAVKINKNHSNSIKSTKYHQSKKLISTSTKAVTRVHQKIKNQISTKRGNSFLTNFDKYRLRLIKKSISSENKIIA